MDERSSGIRIVLADDRAILRAGLRSLLARESDFLVVGEAADGHEVIRLLAETKPDMLLADLNLPGLSAADILRWISSEGHRVRTLVLASADDEARIAEVLRHGARGIVLKEADTKVLFEGIRCVMEGKFWLGHKSVARIGKKLPGVRELSRTESRPSNFGLTRREMEIVGAIVSGFSNKEIARKLKISEDTVKHHLTSAFDKAGVYNRLELALFAIHHGLVGRR